jgi:flagellar hook assembly protein FlgD
VVLDVYSLEGRRVARVTAGLQDSGPQTLRWDGRDASGELLPPGIYLTTIDLLSEFSAEPQFRTVGIAY